MSRVGPSRATRSFSRVNTHPKDVLSAHKQDHFPCELAPPLQLCTNSWACLVSAASERRVHGSKGHWTHRGDLRASQTWLCYSVVWTSY